MVWVFFWLLNWALQANTIEKMLFSLCWYVHGCVKLCFIDFC
jgi:hypothetical protein